MLTQLRVQGFKNLLDLTISFGPFTCIAGLNATGKSNLFDAIRFLHLLSQKPIMEAASALRDANGRATSPEELFTRFGDFRAPKMTFTAELLVQRQVEDEFGVSAQAAISSLRYEIAFQLSANEKNVLELAHESLEPIPLRTARKSLAFNPSREFTNSVISGRRSQSFISTSEGTITVHQEGHGGRKLPAPKSTRTAVGGLASSDFPAILATNHEMASWRTLMLEPSAMRSPSSFRDPRTIDSRGANIPNTVLRLIKSEPRQDVVKTEIANRLSRLIENVHDISITEDERSETRTLHIRAADGVPHSAHSLSDGTLRFLVLTIMDLDPEATGLICLEEPENGIHPERIPAIITLLRDIAVDPQLPVNDDNPLRQVVINTHSPLVVSNISIHDLVYMDPQVQRVNGSIGTATAAFVPPGSWRAKQDQGQLLVRGQILAYIGEGQPPEEASGQRLFDWAGREK